jgi:hypothetical protein
MAASGMSTGVFEDASPKAEFQIPHYSNDMVG